MASWATKRRFMYGGGVILVLTLVVGIVFWSIVYSAPTCSDGVRNGEEKGVDCGGACQRICTSDALNPIVLWSKVFNISGDVYSLVAYVENPNINSKNRRAKYQFQDYDTDNKLITVRDGETSIPKNRKFAIFETGVILKNSKPKLVNFQFTAFSPWEKDTQSEPDVSVTYGAISSSTSPSLSGTVTNNSLQDIPQLELTVFALDSKENVLGASRTFIDNLYKRTSQDFVFTWQKAFEGNISVINVFYRSP